MSAASRSRLKMRARPIDVRKPLQISRGGEDMVFEDEDYTLPTQNAPTNDADAVLKVTPVAAGAVAVIPTPAIRTVPNYDQRMDTLMPRYNHPDHYVKFQIATGAGNIVPGYDFYDMTHDDSEWLANYNSEIAKKAQQISDDEFEQWIDCFEKESFKVTALIDPSSAKFTFPFAFEKACNTKFIYPPPPPTAATANGESKAPPPPAQPERMICSPHKDEKRVEVVYKYWLAKRRRLLKALMRNFQTAPSVEDTAPNVAFRPRMGAARRTSHRNPRKNDHLSFNKLLLLKRNFETVKTLLSRVHTREMIKRDRVLVDIALFDSKLSETQFALRYNMEPLPAVAAAGSKPKEELRREEFARLLRSAIAAAELSLPIRDYQKELRAPAKPPKQPKPKMEKKVRPVKPPPPKGPKPARAPRKGDATSANGLASAGMDADDYESDTVYGRVHTDDDAEEESDDPEFYAQIAAHLERQLAERGHLMAPAQRAHMQYELEQYRRAELSERSGPATATAQPAAAPAARPIAAPVLSAPAANGLVISVKRPQATASSSSSSSAVKLETTNGGRHPPGLGMLGGNYVPKRHASYFQRIGRGGRPLIDVHTRTSWEYVPPTAKTDGKPAANGAAPIRIRTSLADFADAASRPNDGYSDDDDDGDDGEEEDERDRDDDDTASDSEANSDADEESFLRRRERRQARQRRKAGRSRGRSRRSPTSPPAFDGMDGETDTSAAAAASPDADGDGDGLRMSSPSPVPFSPMHSLSNAGASSSSSSAAAAAVGTSVGVKAEPHASSRAFSAAAGTPSNAAPFRSQTAASSTLAAAAGMMLPASGASAVSQSPHHSLASSAGATNNMFSPMADGDGPASASSSSSAAASAGTAAAAAASSLFGAADLGVGFSQFNPAQSQYQ